MQIPSVLFLTGDEAFLVGEAAERRGALEPDRLVREFKRRFGDPVPMLVAGAAYSPESLMARLLRWIVATTTTQQGEAPAEVMLTHPANGGPYKRELLDQVASLADLPGARYCTEPEAAAVRYAARTKVDVGDRIAVYDLGGGTFDVCVLEKRIDGFSVLGTPDGIERLGGADVDEAVTHLVLQALGPRLETAALDDPGMVVGLARLRRDCVDAKETLSSDTDVTIPVALPGLTTTVRITRAELEATVRPALLDTIAAVRRTLASARVRPTCGESCWSVAARGSRWSARCCRARSRSPSASTPIPSTMWRSGRRCCVAKNRPERSRRHLRRLDPSRGRPSRDRRPTRGRPSRDRRPTRGRHPSPR
jgi:molecular chaperone DnaK